MATSLNGILKQSTTMTDAEKMLRKVKRATVELTAAPAFAALSGILDMLRHETSELVPTVLTTGLKNVWNPKWAQQFNPKQIAFIAAHEALHVFLYHNVRPVSYMQQNIPRCRRTIDEVVNNMLEDIDPLHKHIEPPTSPVAMPDGTTVVRINGWLDRRFQGMSLRQVWDILSQEGFGNGEGDGAGGFDDHEFVSDLTPEEAKLMDFAIEAGRQASAKLGRDIPTASPERADYRTLLAQWMYSTMSGNGECDWRRPRRRMTALNVYLPDEVSDRLRKVVLHLDTSASRSGPELAEDVERCKHIARQCGVEELHVIYWDTCVCRHEIYKEAGAETLNETEPAGGGGTVFAPANEYIQNLKPDLMIGFTDGYVCDWGDSPSFPSLWVMSTDVVPPWGKVLHV